MFHKEVLCILCIVSLRIADNRDEEQNKDIKDSHFIYN